MEINARSLNQGKRIKAQTVVVEQPFSFIGDFDPSTGALLVIGHIHYGKTIAGKILVCPGGKGGTMAPFIVYEAYKQGFAPAAIFCDVVDPILFESAMAIDIPIFDQFNNKVANLFTNDQEIIIDDNKIIVKD